MKPSVKLLHVVGGGINQIPLVKTAKRLGFKVLITDIFDSPPCRKIADHFEQADTKDLEKTLYFSKKYKITHITTDQTDVAVATVAYVAEELGLKGIGTKVANRFTNKYKMRKALSVSMSKFIPNFEFFNNLIDAIYYFKNISIDNTFIVKPINSQGSKGVSVLGPNFKNQISKALKESCDEGVIIERFITGPEYSVESFVQNDKVHNLVLVSKDHYKSNPCLDKRNTFFGNQKKSFQDQIFGLNEKIIKSLDLSMGNVHAEYKVENGCIYLMEIAARGGGGVFLA